jgi:hypothetical protein
MLQALQQALLDLERRESELRDWVISEELPAGLSLSEWRQASAELPSAEELAGWFGSDDSGSESDVWESDSDDDDDRGVGPLAADPADSESDPEVWDGDPPEEDAQGAGPPEADPLDGALGGYESSDDFYTTSMPNPRRQPFGDESSDDEDELFGGLPDVPER